MSGGLNLGRCHGFLPAEPAQADSPPPKVTCCSRELHLNIRLPETPIPRPAQPVAPSQLAVRAFNSAAPMHAPLVRGRLAEVPALLDDHVALADLECAKGLAFLF